ncbi:MAG: pilus assembly protein PilO [Burkholderiales bacterium RIFCSPLOWO2_02_FULL_57_36]|nr:MAG: pilus assembly protein PilO [Burkholderiales bacterium RIFCSPLOWO2_02_FULL_57_36]
MADMKDMGGALSAQFRGLNGRHPGQWPLIPRILCGVGVFVAIVGLGWYFYWNNQLEELALGEQEEVKLKEAYKGKIQQAVNLEGLRKQKAQVGEYVASLEKQLPSKAEMDALLSDINQAGIGRGLQFELFKPGQVVVKDYYAELPISIKVTGNYHDVGAFTSDIANLPRIVTLNNMNLVTLKDGVLTLDAVAKTFRYLDKDEVSAQRKGGKK